MQDTSFHACFMVWQGQKPGQKSLRHDLTSLSFPLGLSGVWTALTKRRAGLRSQRLAFCGNLVFKVWLSSSMYLISRIDISPLSAAMASSLN